MGVFWIGSGVLLLAFRMSSWAQTPAPSSWHVELPGFVFNAPAVGNDGTVFATAYRPSPTPGEAQGALLAIGPDSAVRWQRWFTNQVLGPPALTENGRLYVSEQAPLFEGGKLWAIDANDKVEWILDTQQQIITAPALATNDTVYVASYNETLFPQLGRVLAVRGDGSVEWSTTNLYVTFSPTLAVANDGAILAGLPNALEVLRLHPDGSTQWLVRLLVGSFEYGSGFALTSDGAILFSVHNGLVKMAADGSILWSYPSTDTLGPPVIGPGDAIYVGGGSNRFLALGMDGAVQWMLPTRAPVTSAAAVAADGAVYFGAQDGTFYCVNADGTIRWEFAAEGAIVGSPVIAPEGTVCFGTASGFLFGLAGKTGPAQSAWPMFQHDGRRTGASRARPVLPEAPGSFVAGAPNGCAGFIRLSWASSPGATHYEVWRHTIPDLPNAIALATNLAGNLEFNDDTAAFDTEFYYWIRAVNSVGISRPNGPVVAGQRTKLWQVEVPGLRTIPAVNTTGGFYVATVDEGSTSGGIALGFSNDGQRRWQTPLEGRPFEAPSIGPDGTIYFLIQENDTIIVAIDPNGIRKWQVRPGFVRGRMAVSANGELFLARPGLAAISPEGTLLWRTSASPAAPLIGGLTLAPDNTILLPTVSGVSAYRPDGQPKWTYRSRGVPYGISTDREGNFLFLGDDQLYKGNAEGRLRWRARIGRSLENQEQEPAIAADGSAFYCGSRIQGFNADGVGLWEITNGFSQPFCPVLAADGRIYAAGNRPLGSRERAMVKILHRDGSVECEWPLRDRLLGAPLMRHDGVILAALESGRVQAFQGSSPPEQGGWPMFRHDAQGTSHVPEPPTPPSAPTSVTTASFVDKVRVGWLARPALETNEIWRATMPDLSDAVRLAVVGPGQNFFYDPTAQAGQRYFYAVRAWTRYGSSERSQGVVGKMAVGVERVWSLTLSNAVRSCVLGFDGTIYVAGPGCCGFDGLLRAVNPSGELLWQLRDGEAGFSDATVEADGTILYGLARYGRDGRSRGRVGTTEYASSAPAVNADGQIFAALNQERLGAFSSDGTVLWTRELPINQNTDPVLAPNGDLLISIETNLVSWSGAGDVNWTFPLPGSRPDRVAVDSTGASYFQTGSYFVSVNADGLLRWRLTNALPALRMMPAVGPDDNICTVLTTSFDPRDSLAPGYQQWLRKLTPAGIMLWETPIGSSTTSPSAITVAQDGTIYTIVDNHLAAFTSEGQLKWQFDTGSATPPSASILGLDGRLYFAAGKTLFALQTDSGPAASWSMIRGHPRGTSSLNRPTPPMLRVVRDGAGIELRLEPAASTPLTLLSANHLGQWRISQQTLDNGGPLRIGVSQVSEFFRLGIP